MKRFLALVRASGLVWSEHDRLRVELARLVSPILRRERFLLPDEDAPLPSVVEPEPHD